MALNLSSFSTKDQATLHLVDPATGMPLYDDDNNPVEIVIYGPSSKQSRNATLAMQNRYLNKGSKKKESAEANIKEGTDILVACSIRANNLVLPDGSSIDSPAAFNTLYNDPTLEWLKDQVLVFSKDVSNFLGK